jgi:hypothetical protein
VLALNQFHAPDRRTARAVRAAARLASTYKPNELQDHYNRVSRFQGIAAVRGLIVSLVAPNVGYWLLWYGHGGCL